MLVWSSTWVVIALGLEDVAPFFGAGLRFVLAGLGVLLELQRAADARGVAFGLVNVHEPIRKVFTVTNLDKVFKVFN